MYASGYQNPPEQTYQPVNQAPPTYQTPDPPLSSTDPSKEPFRESQPHFLYNHEAAPSKFSFCESEKDNPFRKQHRAIRQFWKLFAHRAFRGFLNIVYMGALLAVFHIYQEIGVMSTWEKRVFNTINTGLTLLLSLNVVASFKGMAGIFRWRVLASARYGGHTAEEVDMILSMKSYMTCSQLLWRWKGKPKYFLSLAWWVLLGLGVQVAIAMLGFAIEQNSEGAFSTVFGDVNVTDFSHFWVDPERTPTFYEENYRAHLYGQTSEFLVTGDPDLEVNPDGFMGDRLEILQHEEDQGSGKFKYRFNNFAKTEWTKDVRVSIKSDRSVTVETKCKYYPIISRDPYIAIQLPDDEFHEFPLYTPHVIAINSTTTYLSPSLHKNATEVADGAGHDPDSEPPNSDCGPRCGVIEIFHLPAYDIEGRSIGEYFKCNTTVSEVENATDDVQELSDLFALRAASSIGSSGVIMPYGGANSYNIAAYWSMESTKPLAVGETIPEPGDTKLAEFMVARYAVGTIAMMDKHAIKLVPTKGQSPRIGTQLEVKWERAALIFAMILSAQMISGLVTLIISWHVLVKEDSALVAGKALESLVAELGGRGSMSDLQELSEFYGKEDKWRYGVAIGENGAQKVGIFKVREIKDDKFEGQMFE